MGGGGGSNKRGNWYFLKKKTSAMDSTEIWPWRKQCHMPPDWREANVHGKKLEELRVEVLGHHAISRIPLMGNRIERRGILLVNGRGPEGMKIYLRVFAEEKHIGAQVGGKIGEESSKGAVGGGRRLSHLQTLRSLL